MISKIPTSPMDEITEGWSKLDENTIAKLKSQKIPISRVGMSSGMRYLFIYGASFIGVLWGYIALLGIKKTINKIQFGDYSDFSNVFISIFLLSISIFIIIAVLNEVAYKPEKQLYDNLEHYNFEIRDIDSNIELITSTARPSNTWKVPGCSFKVNGKIYTGFMITIDGESYNYPGVIYKLIRVKINYKNKGDTYNYYLIRYK